jgi:hypothetical protein
LELPNIERAIANGELFLLQCRSLTCVDGRERECDMVILGKSLHENLIYVLASNKSMFLRSADDLESLA